MTDNRSAIGLGILLGVLLVASPSKGPDFDFYLDWSFATLSGDIFKLRAGLLSPLGVPLSQWSVGPGLLFAVAWLALGGIRPEAAAAMAAGAFSSLLFWASLLLLLRRATGNDGGLTLFGLAAAFLGTHAGFYSLSHASESLSLGPGALMIVLLTSRRPWSALQCLWMGASAGLLVLVRGDYLVYAAPALLLAAVRAWRSWGNLGQSQRALRLGLLTLPLGFAMLPMVAVNRWMTGDPWRSPYVFGDGGFRSLDWTSPEMLAVVGHPHHGLIPYHPLFGLGLFALVWCIWRAPSREEGVLWAAGLASVVAHLYLQASWYAWWLGPLTFGMRALSLAAIVVVPALARFLARASPRSAARRSWLLASTLACIWSTLLLLQQYTHFYAWADLWDRQVTFAKALPHSTEAIPLVVGLACAVVLVVLMRRGRPWEWALLSTGVLLSGLAVGYLLSRACRRWTRRGALEELRVVLTVLALVLLVAALMALSRRLIRNATAAAVFEGALGCVASLSLATALLLFSGLALRTEAHIAAGTPPPREFVGVSTVVWSQVGAMYGQYQRIPGFEAKKAGLLAYLRSHGVEP